MKLTTTSLMVLMFAATANSPVMATGCGSLTIRTPGPWDYRNATRYQISIVEEHHFTSDIENLSDSTFRSAIGDHIGYTLRAIPNHPRALWAMVRLSRKARADPPPGSEYTVECWFERAVRFKPDDGHVRLLLGLWLESKGNKKQAAEQLEIARTYIEGQPHLKDDPSINYNLGLGFFEVGQHDLALTYAKRAKELGFPLDGLEKKLRRAGKWQG